jgi:imidazole glycerol phosphate synthase glutamine amidotransferase subunit
VSTIALVPTGTANTASVVAAFNRLGVTVTDVGDAAGVGSADLLVLPGVGAFGAAMGQVDALGLRQALEERVEADRPTLAICVGMQLLTRESDESPDATGLGVVDATVRRFGHELRVPQLGWNRVEPDPGSRLLEAGWAYFANSFRLETLPEGWIGATTDYGGLFVSAMERGNVLACQFHPELSGPWGARLLGRWLQNSMVPA